MGSSKTTRIMLVAGEASGDLHGAGLMAELASLLPQARFYGMGGRRMEAAGLQTCHSGQGVFGTSGLFEVFGRTWSLLSALRTMKRSLRADPPDLFIPIDFPDFNFRLGHLAKRLRIPVVYFISPQVWAWRKGRIGTLARMVRRMLVIFPFEEQIYRSSGLDARFVGHPLLDVIGPAPKTADRDQARRELGLGGNERLVVLLPGSRKGEVSRILPTIIASARKIAASHSDVRFCLVRAESLRGDPEVTRAIEGADLEGLIEVAEDRFYPVLRAAEAAVVASGTATVETALHLVPMVVVYRVNPLTYLLGRTLISVDNFAMVNLIAGRPVVSELLQHSFTASGLTRELCRLLDDRQAAEAVRAELETVRRRMGEPGAYARAARAVVELLP